MKPRIEKRAPRCTIGADGRHYVSVTSAMGLVKMLLGEEPDYFGPQAAIHAAEGTACHAVCLDTIAFMFGWLPEITVPPWPAEHPAKGRWYDVLTAARDGFAEFVDQYKVEPLAIEQESYSVALGLVGHLDLFCKLKYKGRRVKAVVDLKFVAGLTESHRLQVRCYGRLEGFRDATIGLLYHANRTTGVWKVEEVNLNERLEDVLAVSHAAKLYTWQQTHHPPQKE